MRIHSTPITESGAVLVISLLILMVMTIIGITAVSTTVLQERMAGNLREQSLALQSAEALLRAAQDQIDGLPNTAGFSGDGTGGLYTPVANAPTDLDTIFLEGSADDDIPWGTAKSVEFSRTIHPPGDDATHSRDIELTGRYFIEDRGNIPVNVNADLNITGYGQAQTPTPVTAFRIVARGEGGARGARTYVQSYYGRRFGP